MLYYARLACALLGMFAVGLSQANACGCCCRCRPVAYVVPGPVLAAPACCLAPAAAPAQVAAADKDQPKAAASKDDEAEIKENLAKLPEKDRKLAEAQKYCAIEDDHRLGEMGVPVKVMVKGEPVFLCCKGCQKKALADPDKTLAKVKELKAKAKEEDKK